METTNHYEQVQKTCFLSSCNTLGFACLAKCAHKWLRHRLSTRIIRLRNTALFLLLIQIFLAFLRVVSLFVRKNTVMIIFNVFTIFISLLGILGQGLFNIYLYSIYLFAEIILMALFIIFLAISAQTNPETLKGIGYLIYLPLFLDLIFIFIHTYIFCPYYTWYTQSESAHENENTHPIPNQEHPNQIVPDNMVNHIQPDPDIGLQIQEERKEDYLQSKISQKQDQSQIKQPNQFQSKQQHIKQEKSKKQSQQKLQPIPKSNPPERSNSIEGYCVVCIANKIDTVLLNCRHTTCYQCAQILMASKPEQKRCPTCRQPIEDCIKFYN